MKPILSILTPTIPERIDRLRELSSTITPQIHGQPVEHLYIGDHCGMSIGEKRQRLVDIARGEYIAFVDDDDEVHEDYVALLLVAASRGADVITFRQRVTYCGQEGEIQFDAAHPTDDPFRPGETVKRPPWHVCAWRRELIAECVFAHTNYGEDLAWCRQARRCIERATHINRVLHHYTHDPETTAAPPND